MKYFFPLRNFLSLSLVILITCVPADAVSQNKRENAVPTASPGKDVLLELIGASPSPSPAISKTPRLSAKSLGALNVRRRLPPGGLILFTAKAEGYERILLLDFQQNKFEVVVDGPGNNSYASWSPDGTKFTFVSDRSGDKEIYVANWDGKNQTRLTFRPGTDADPSWHPDGRHIVFYSEEEGRSHTNLFQVKVPPLGKRPKPPERITEFTGRNTTPKVSPDRRVVVYSTNRFWPGWDVCGWIFKRKSEVCYLRGKESFFRPSWSPDGKKLAYSTGAGLDIEVGVFNLEFQDRVIVSDSNMRDYDASFSPDGEWMLLASERERRELFNLYSIELEHADRQAPELLVSAPFSLRYPSWSSRRLMQLEALRIKEHRSEPSGQKP